MKKVFVAMSGGVDSSVAAALLQREGYKVTGVFIKIWMPDFSTCDWRAERRDAMRAAAKISLPLITFDLSSDYKKSVIDYLLREYEAGRTPNPDIMCNKEIKFGVFYREAMKRGADIIATGHYAQIVTKSLPRLVTSKDKDKDQTYFLWTLSPEILAKTLFPIGKYRKSEVRKLAEKFGLPNAAKPDSQGLCFIGQVNFKDFLARYLPEKIGQVLNDEGAVVGEHRGAHFYTIGERHGFTLFHQTSNKAPYYIVAKDSKNNILTVSTKSAMINWATKEIRLSELNWIGEKPKAGARLSARCRYRAPLTPCRVELIRDEARVVFDQPQAAIAPGQSCVFYNSREAICLGGGVIAGK